MQASQILEIVIVTLHPFGCCSTIKYYAFRAFQHRNLSVALLHLLITLFSFQGTNRFTPLRKLTTIFFQLLLKPDFKVQCLGFEIQQQTLSGGPEWARTTDLTIISRTL